MAAIAERIEQRIDGPEPAEFASPDRRSVEETIANRRHLDTIFTREQSRRETIVRRIRELEAKHGDEADAILDDPARCRELLAETMPRLARYVSELQADRSRRLLLRSEILKALDRREEWPN